MKQETPIQPLAQTTGMSSQLQLMLAIELLNYNGPIFTTPNKETIETKPANRSAS